MSEGVALQPRDLSILPGLFESRILSLAHVAALHFEGKSEAAKKRVQKLKSAGFISERARRVNEPSLLFLTAQGFSHLQSEGLLSTYPRCSLESFEKRIAVSPVTIRHELDVLDVKASLMSAIRAMERFRVLEFTTWPALCAFEATHPKTGKVISVKPDGFIRVEEEEPDGGLYEHSFFLEVDRSSESQEVLAAKGHCYLDYYRKGGFAEKNGAPTSAYKEFPFRVLFVLKTEERKDNAARRLLENNPPIFTQVWLTTMKEVLEHPLEEVWIRPADFRSSPQTDNHQVRRRYPKVCVRGGFMFTVAPSPRAGR